MSASNKIIELLNKKIKKKNIYDKLLTEEGAYAGLSVGDLFYDYLRVDPEVVKTLDIIHPNDDLQNPIAVGWYKKKKMDFFQENSENPDKAWQGHENRDFGYSGERYFGQQFQNQNSEVTFPDSLNNPGYDLKDAYTDKYLIDFAKKINESKFSIIAIDGIAGSGKPEEYFETIYKV